MRDKLNQIFNTQKSVCKIDSEIIQGEPNNSNFVEKKVEKNRLKSCHDISMHCSACGFHLMNYVQYVHHLERSVYVYVCVCEREREAYLLGSFSLSIA